MALPSHVHFRRPLLESLGDGEVWKLSASLDEVARRMKLAPDDLAERIPAGHHSLAYDRLCWARWYLAQAGLVAIPRRGFTQITPRGSEALREAPDLITDEYLSRFQEFRDYIELQRQRRGKREGSDEPAITNAGIPQPDPEPHVWIEKTIVQGRPDRQTGPFSIGKALWSPKQAKGGADIYRFMRDVAPGDIILHLTDNEGFTGTSEAESTAVDFEGLHGTEWGGEPSYRIPLKNYRKLQPPLLRETFFTPPYRDRLVELISSGYKNLFYNKAPALNQGAYLTPAPSALVRILNDAYRSAAGEPLVNEFSHDISGEDASLHANFFDALVRSTYWTESALSSIIDAIRHPVAPSRQIILAGPPGTSKTYVAQELIKCLTHGDTSRSRIVQFHPSYSYEQFIEGLRPTITSGAVKFDVVPGIVLEMAEQCRASNESHFLLIDELNRANLPRVLGA